MKQPRRWTAFLTVLLMAASLIFAQEGSAGPVRGFILPGDPTPLPEIGDPDVPEGTIVKQCLKGPIGIRLVIGPNTIMLVPVAIRPSGKQIQRDRVRKHE